MGNEDGQIDPAQNPFGETAEYHLAHAAMPVPAHDEKVRR
jgi:hypothetical protein